MFDKGPRGLPDTGDGSDFRVQRCPCLSEQQRPSDKDEHDERQNLGPDHAGGVTLRASHGVLGSRETGEARQLAPHLETALDAALSDER